MTDGQPLRWAILGTGFISHATIDAIAGSEGSIVEVIAGRNEDSTAQMCEQHGVARSSTSFADTVADPSVDVVYIALPNHKHADLAIASAEAGKAVLSEKSLTTTMEDAHRLVDAVRANETFFVEGLMYLAHPLFGRLRAILADGRLGGLRSIRGHYAADIAHLVNPAGGGTLFNLGCYPTSLLHFAMQELCGADAFNERQISVLGNRDQASGNVVDAAISIRFDNGVLATLQSSDNYGNGSEFAISGDNGTLRFSTNPWLPLAGDNVLSWQPFDGPHEEIVVNDANDAFYHQTKMVEHHVRSGHTEAARPSPRWSDSLEIMQLLTEWEAGC